MNVILRLVARPDAIEALRPVLLELASQSRKEAGCIDYQVLQNAVDPSDFTLWEQWTSEAALDAHLKTVHVAKAFAEGGPRLAAAPDSRRYLTVD